MNLRNDDEDRNKVLMMADEQEQEDSNQAQEMLLSWLELSQAARRGGL